MTNGLFTVLSNERAAKDIYKIVLQGDVSAIKRPGQFVNIALEGFFLRRPFSVSSWDNETFSVFYKIAGNGTKKMSGLPFGAILDILTGLGNGYDTALARHKRILLVGGGVGVPPLIGLAAALLKQGERPEAVLGFNSAAGVVGLNEFLELGVAVRVATLDGSFGEKGTVIDLLGKADCDYYFACGAMPMLALVHRAGLTGQLSLEARMACGFGACMSCSCNTKNGSKLICTDGPVFLSSEVAFDE